MLASASWSVERSCPNFAQTGLEVLGLVRSGGHPALSKKSLQVAIFSAIGKRFLSKPAMPNSNNYACHPLNPAFHTPELGPVDPARSNVPHRM
jgi:hypothetical protein